MTMKQPCVFKVLTKRHTGSSHEHTELTIKWDGMTEDDLYALAARALIHDFQATAVKSKQALPDRVTVDAACAVRRESAALIQYDPSRLKINVKVDKQLEAALKSLTPDELAALLG